LEIPKKFVEAHDIGQPRTVCGHRTCVEHQSQGIYNMRDQTTIYKTICLVCKSAMSC
jgi:hypothetical protein